MRRAELQARWTAKPSDDDRTTMNDPKPTTIPALLTRVREHLDTYMQLLRKLPSDHPSRAEIGPLTLTSSWCAEAIGMVRVHTPEPAANVRVEDEAEVPPMTYMVLLPGRRLDPVDCWQVPDVGDTITSGPAPFTVRRRKWSSAREAWLVCDYGPGWEPGGESF
jgi:hypothetical protein